MPSHLWERVFVGQEPGDGSDSASGSLEIASNGGDQHMDRSQEQTLNEVRDMEFEMIARLEAERALHEKQLQLMTKQAEKLDGHTAILEKVLAQQRALNQTMQRLSSQQEQVPAMGGQVVSSSPAQPVVLPSPRAKDEGTSGTPPARVPPAAAPAEAPARAGAPHAEALRRIEARVAEVQRAMERAAGEPAPRARDVQEAEADSDVVVEFGGLWYEGKGKHIISGKHLYDATGAKSELVIYNQREFTVNGAAMGHAHVAKDGQSLLWSSGRLWTRSSGKKHENLQAKLQKMHGRERKHLAAEDDAVAQTSASEATMYRMPWSKKIPLREELTKIRSIFGDSLRDQAVFFDSTSMISKTLVRIADFADWMEVQHRAPMAQEGRLDRFVQSVFFEFISAFLILANAVYIGRTTTLLMENPLEENIEWIRVVDVTFALFFTLELGLRACSLRNMFFFGPDAIWYLFDIILISLSFGEFFVGSSGSYAFLRGSRVFKLARVIRMVRTLRIFSELRLLLDCMLGSLNSLVWCLIVIAFVFYMFAIIFVQGLANVRGDIQRELNAAEALDNYHIEREATDEQILARWGSVRRAMLTLWEATTGGLDWQAEYELVSEAGVIHSTVFIVFIAFMIIVVWNIVTSTILEKALRFAQPDIYQLLMDKRRRDSEDVEILLAMLQKSGVGISHKITEEEFLMLLSQKDMADFLQVRGIDIKEAHSFFGLLTEVFIVFIAFMIIVVWNIVTSTILEKALRFAQPDIDQLLMDKRRRDSEDVEILLAMLQKSGFEISHKITEEEFLMLLSQKDMADFLQVRGIDIKEAHSFFGLLTEDPTSEGVDAASFIATCLRIKGVATSIDLHTIHYQTMGILRRQGKLITDTVKSLREVAQAAPGQPARLSVSAGSEASEAVSSNVGLENGKP